MTGWGGGRGKTSEVFETSEVWSGSHRRVRLDAPFEAVSKSRIARKVRHDAPCFDSARSHVEWLMVAGGFLTPYSEALGLVEKTRSRSYHRATLTEPSDVTGGDFEDAH